MKTGIDNAHGAETPGKRSPVFPSRRQEAHKSLTLHPQVSDSGRGSRKWYGYDSLSYRKEAILTKGTPANRKGYSVIHA
ncbi:hypothetical protein [uncultured Bacteroides sp.]|uniref:hypothetical protein n=1 Tax=uncultured Bacteroides sp. TaxID=162156 RepID=UPI0025EEB7B3|nr:hypothetical protein [uncultured Bacteroides sp.]